MFYDTFLPETVLHTDGNVGNLVRLILLLLLLFYSVM